MLNIFANNIFDVIKLTSSWKWGYIQHKVFPKILLSWSVNLSKGGLQLEIDIMKFILTLVLGLKPWTLISSTFKNELGLGALPTTTGGKIVNLFIKQKKNVLIHKSNSLPFIMITRTSRPEYICSVKWIDK